MRLYSRVMDEVDALAEQLRISVDRLSRSARRAQALPPGEAAVLGALDRDGPQTIARLADERGVRHQTAAKIVAQLEASDLVTKRSHPDDARMVQVRLTRRGAATLRRDRAARASWLADAIKTQLNARQRQRLDEVAEVLGALASYEPET